MGDVFRVIEIPGGQESHRFVKLVDACLQWVKSPQALRVEQIHEGSTTPLREVSVGECCSVLRAWFATDPHLVPDAERDDLARLIQDACPKR
jgi:hypothetical protein